jgi:outer membrane lipoprotein-sorting protein
MLRRAVLALGLCACFTAPVITAPALADPAAPSAEDRALEQKAQAYLSGLKGAEGRFTQTDPKGHGSAGRFFLLKPGRARFQYDPPTALLVVADGANVSVYDRKLKTFDQYPLAQTPLALLLAKDVKLDGRVAASIADKTAKGFTLDLRDAKHPADGRLLLSFTNAPVSLAGWTVVDAQNQRTTVRLANLKTATPLSPGLFVLNNPRPH